MPGLDSDIPEGKDEQIIFYKETIRELEEQLAEFQASSSEIEKELEKELESNEKQIRELVRKNEALKYEVDEWKAKSKQSRLEANNAQNALQKEITTLRSENRTLQHKLRDMELSNDDFERQERIVQSSLEDLESKYNHSLERNVMQEEEIKIGEQEREDLRIEVQRLRDELADLKVEQEITLEKLKNTTAIAAKYGNGSLHHVPPPNTFSSPASDTASVITDTPSTPITTPTASRSTPSERSSPPSPPISEVSTTPSVADPATTPRPRNPKPTKTRHTRVPSISSTTLPMPASKSLYQIRGLIGQMQRLEKRVQSARSKLPAPTPTSTPVKPSGIPTIGSVPPLRRKSRPSSTASTASSASALSDRGYGRPSYGYERPASVAERPESRQAVGRMNGFIRPHSRISNGDYEPSPRRSLGVGNYSSYGRRGESESEEEKPGDLGGYSSVNGAGVGLGRRNTMTSGIPVPGSGIPVPGSGLRRPGTGLRRSGAGIPERRR